MARQWGVLARAGLILSAGAWGSEVGDTYERCWRSLGREVMLAHVHASYSSEGFISIWSLSDSGMAQLVRTQNQVWVRNYPAMHRERWT